jgi:hypothetical protein
MAFEIIKTTFNRIAAKVSCGCSVRRDYAEWNYKTPLNEVIYEACEKHEEEGGSTIEFILAEYLDTEITRIQNSAPTNNPQGPGEIVRDAEGNEIGTKIPGTAGRHRPQPKVRPALPPRQAPKPATAPLVDGVEIDPSSIDAMINGTDTADNSETILPTTD